MKVIANTDGSARPTNPGPAGIGVVFYEWPEGGMIPEDGLKELYSICRPIGWATNNVAEYTAVQEAVEWWVFADVLEDSENLEIRTDSALVANQVNGEWKGKDPVLTELRTEIQQLIRALKLAGLTITLVHIPRSENKQADKLAYEAAGLNPIGVADGR